MQSLCWCARGSHVHQSQWNTECRAPVATPSAGVTYVSLSLSLSLYLYLSLSLSLSLYVYIYIYIHIHKCIYIYIYLYTHICTHNMYKHI